MATIFIPPSAPGRPYALRNDRPYSSLFRFYGSIAAGTNIWLLNDGTITTHDPADESVVRRVFHGGHIHEVDDDEAALLADAGYLTIDAPVYGEGLYGAGAYGSGHYGGSN